MRHLTDQAKATRVSEDVAAGSTDINCTILDMANFEAVQFMVSFGAITAGAATGVKIQQGDDSGLSDAQDLLGSALAIVDTDDDKLLITDIVRPEKRYVRLVITRATQNSVIDSATALQYGAHNEPVTQDATTVAGSEKLASPIEGTA